MKKINTRIIQSIFTASLMALSMHAFSEQTTEKITTPKLKLMATESLKYPKEKRQDDGLLILEQASPKKSVDWLIKKSNASIKTDLEEWCKKAGWSLSWEIKDGVDLSVDQDLIFKGDLESALNQLAESLSFTDMPVSIEMYKGNQFVRVIYVNGTKALK